MYELIQTGADTWYMSASTNTGFYRCSSGEVCLIDSADRTSAEHALRHIREHGWRLTGLYLTHSHADHSGGAAYLREQTGCEVYAPGISAAAVENSFLVTTTLYGGAPSGEMCTRIICPPACTCRELTPDVLPEGLEFTRLDGHDMAQAAFRTKDGVWFTGDCVISAEALAKHRISFLYHPGQHLRALDILSELSGELFVPAHDLPCRDIRPLTQVNRAALLEVASDIREMCVQPITIDEIIEKALEKYGIRLYLIQYLLVGATVRSYLSWLLDKGEVRTVFSGTKLLWQRTDAEL